MSVWDNLYAPPKPTLTPIMMGVHGARRLVYEYLKATLPSVLAKLGEQWGISDDTAWVKPKNYYDYEMSRVVPSETPLICVTVPNTARSIPQGMDDMSGEPVMMSQYNIRVYNFITADGVEACTRARDYYITAIRIALTMQNGGLQLPGQSCADRPFQAMVDSETMREEYSEITGGPGSVYYAGAFVTFTLQAVERASIKSLDDLPTVPELGWVPVVQVVGTEGLEREAFAFSEEP